jgi:D-alanyl-D-alanine carboxypeptidase (penicillin-binding protein 5/6)
VQEAVALSGVGTIAASSDQTPQPIASLTKIMSALVILRDRPLAIGESGPSIAITSSDVTQYHLEKAEGDSVVKVRAGETLTELQALEAALIPSGDNITQLLAKWDAGSDEAFTAQMNALARSIGMRQTSYAGTSGVDPASVSTANDQLRLAEVAMSNLVFAGTVAMPQVTLPVAGVLYNVNADLGRNGINGVKTGWLPESGGCIVFSALERVESQNVSIVGVILGQGGRTPIPSALRGSRNFVKAVEEKLRVDRLGTNSIVANYDASDGQVIPIVTTSPLSLIGVSGSRVRVDIHLTRSISKRLAARTPVGTVVVSIGAERDSSAIRTASSLTDSSVWWRFTHP